MGPSTRQLSEAKHAARLPPGPAPGAMSGPVEPEEPDLSPAVAARRGLRTGWTTGTCASAAAKAAYLALVSGRRPERVEVALPSGQRVGFPVESVEAGAPRAVVEAATETATARHFFDACMAHRCLAPLALLYERARAACLAHAGSSFELEMVLADYEGSSALWRAGP